MASNNTIIVGNQTPPARSSILQISDSEKVKNQRENLRTLYNKSKNLIQNFQSQHNKIKQEETILKNLQDRYYEALQKKKFHENDRDVYFKQGDDLLAMRNQLLDTSIDILNEQNTYYKASENFNTEIINTLNHKDRKVNNIERKLEDLEKSYTSVQNRLDETCVKLNDTISELKISKLELENTQKENSSLVGKNENLKSQIVRLEEERQDILATTERLNQKCQKLEENNLNLSKQVASNDTEIQKYKTEISKISENLKKSISEFKNLEQQHSELIEKSEIDQKTNSKIQSELKNMVLDYQKEIQNYEVEVTSLTTKNKQNLLKIDAINQKMNTIARAKNNAIQSEYKYRKANVEINERYQALLERAMELIESDSNKNIQLQLLTKDNIKLSKKIDAGINAMQFNETAVNKSGLKTTVTSTNQTNSSKNNKKSKKSVRLNTAATSINGTSYGISDPFGVPD